MHRVNSWAAIALIASSVATGGCASNAQRIDRLAQSAGLTRHLIETGGYSSLIYMKDAPGTDATGRGAPLLVFLEGDGRPWNGLTPSADPTTRNPLALKLLLQTPFAGAYVTRPCYHELQGADCTPRAWTSARYSETTVTNMAAVVREAARIAKSTEIVLVGYSGGGALAVLIAERLDEVAAVVTIAANLDTDAWTANRHLPLTDSLNPAASERAHAWPELHLHGGNDVVVPIATTAAYFQRHPAARLKVIDDYGHVCCWIEHWPALFAGIQQELSFSRAASAASGKSENTPSTPSAKN